MTHIVSQQRTYIRHYSVVFSRTKEKFGGLSNMAAGFPLEINGVYILTSEAIYQACRFPYNPEFQKEIIQQRSPMAAKMKSRAYISETRPDWDKVRVAAMRWCLGVKLAQNWENFRDLLLSTGDLPIVEYSHKDNFWGAKPECPDILVGRNVLGRLLMGLRDDLQGSGSQKLQTVKPLNIPAFFLYGQQIETVTSIPE